MGPARQESASRSIAASFIAEEITLAITVRKIL
jgi:hypothetical protein